MEAIKLTQYSHGAGCGCKISPKILESIISSETLGFADPNLLVGNQDKDDAAAYDLGNGQVIISTTDFFMPIVDDPFVFGQIAAVNAISDVYAMGGKPLMAIAILGWPINKLAPEVAKMVLDGGKEACRRAGIALAGGHSIDSPEPIFGLAVTGTVDKQNLKQNNKAKPGCLLFLTKPLGVGIITTAQKKGLVAPEDLQAAINSMTTLNDIGAALGELPYVRALTDVTGFGLLGHLAEVCEGSGVSAVIDPAKVPFINAVEKYIELASIPGGTQRNWDSYGHHIADISPFQQKLFCDPQTSGGLLIAVDAEQAGNLQQILVENGMPSEPFGEIITRKEKYIFVAS